MKNNKTILKGTGTSEFPPPLKWKKIQKITKDYDVDALIILELKKTFDSSSSFIDLGLKNNLKGLKKMVRTKSM